MASKGRLNKCIGELKAVFQEYASKDCEQGQCQFKLSKRDLKELVQKELDMDAAKDPAKIEKMMNMLDENDDGQLNFHEFVMMVIPVACLCIYF